MTVRKHAQRIAQLLAALFLLLSLLTPLNSFLNTVTPAQAASVPTLTVPGPTQVFLGSPFSFTLKLSTATTGYGPIIDLMLPPGISFNGATYLGVAVTAQGPIAPPAGAACPAGDTPQGHPFFVDTTNQPLPICVPAGATFEALQLPFGSVVPSMPTINIDVNATLSGSVTVGTPLNIDARAGFQFGSTPLNDWCCDAPIASLTSQSPVPTNWAPFQVTPILVKLAKTYDGPEGETATGPNFPRTYTVTATIAPGQTITNLTIRDVLPIQHQYTGGATSTPPGATITFTPVAGSVTGGTITANFASASGSVSVKIPFIAPQNFGSPATVLLDPNTGAPVTSTNNANITTGTWNGNVNPPYVLVGIPGPVGVVNRSLAIQKNADKSVYNVGDTITYTLHFQVSDFFAFNNLVVTDLLGDAQTYVPNSATYNVTYRDDTTQSGSFTSGTTLQFPPPAATACPVSGNPDPDSFPNVVPGGTVLQFNLSQILAASPDGPGTLYGGRTRNTTDLGAEGTITFQAVIQKQYNCAFGANDPKVNHLDLLYNDVQISGAVLNPATGNPTGSTVTDTSSSTVTVSATTLTKSLFRVTRGGTPLTPAQIAAGLNPGDLVTYDITYQMPMTSFEKLTITDFLPIPTFTVAGFANGQAPSGSPPGVNQWAYGPADTYNANFGGVHPPNLIVDPANNSLTWDFTTFQDPNTPIRPSTIDLLLTVAISDAPYADQLKLTNRATAAEGTTDSINASLDGIIQIVVNQPDMRFFKGIVSTTGASPVYTPNGGSPTTPAGPAGAVWTVPLSGGQRWSGGNFAASNIVANPIDSDISGLVGGDYVTFAVVMSNTGHGPNGAFNLTIKDALPPGLTYVPGSMRIAFGGSPGTTINAVNAGTGLPAVDGDLFSANGIRLADNPLTGVCQAEAINPAFSTIIIVYDAQIDPNINSNTTLKNAGELTRYSSTSAGPNFLANGPLTDFATVTASRPTVVKTIIGTRRFSLPALPSVIPPTVPPTATIGEEVVYQIVLSIPKGTTPQAKLTDTLPVGLAFSTSPGDLFISNTANLSTNLGGGFPAAITGGNVTVTNNVTGSSTLTVNLGDITNSTTTPTTPETVTLLYTAVVLNVNTNIGGTTLNNDAKLSYFNQPANQTYTVNAQSPATISLIQPQPTIQKTIKPPVKAFYQAGDTLSYVLVVNNASGGTNATAYNVQLQDQASSQLQVTGVTNTAGDVPTTGPAVSGGGLVTAAWNQLDTGHSSTIQVDVKVLIGVTPGQVINNTGNIIWQSLPGTTPFTPLINGINESVPRTGDFTQPGSATNYHASATVPLTIQATAPTKTVKATSETFTPDTPAPPAVAIGEVVRYRMAVSIPRSTVPNFSLRDALPANLQLIGPDASTKVAFVCGSNVPAQCITSDAAGLNEGALPGLTKAEVVAGSPTTTPTAVMPAGLVTVASGTITFNMGNLVNNATDANTEWIVVEFNAVVLNQPANVAGTQIDNTFQVWYGSPAAQQPGNSTTARVIVNEAKLTASKTISQGVGPFQAGDTVTFNLVIQNGTGANVTNAYNLKISDLFDSFLAMPAAAGITATVTQLSGTATACALAGPTMVVTGQQFTGTIDCLAPGYQVVFSIPTTVIATVPAGYTINNSFTSTAESLPGTTGAGNATGSATPGAVGAANGARVYTPGASAPAATVAIPSMIKGTPTPATWTIGDLIPYDIRVTLPKGVTHNLQIVEQVPAGLRFENAPTSFQVITTVAASGGALTNDFAGTVVAPTLNPASGTVVDGAANMTFTFGDGTVPIAAASNAETFILRVFLRVRNLPATVAGTQFTNSAQMSFTPGTGNTPSTTTSSAGPVTIIAPNVVTTKQVTSAGPYQAGDNVSYTVTFTNSGNSPAYNVTGTDVLAPHVVYNGDMACSLNGTGLPAPTVTGTTTLTFPSAPSAPWTIPSGQAVTCTYSVKIQPAAAIDGTYTNTLTTTWDSQSSPATPENRHYAPTPGVTANFTIAAPTLAKKVDLATATIGDTLTYTLTLTSPLGSLDKLSIIDTLPTGVSYIANSTTITGVSTPTSTEPALSNGNQTLTWTWLPSDAQLTASPATIVFKAAIDNVAGNIAGVTVSNTANATYTNLAGTVVTLPNVTADTKLVEAKLSITKTVLPPLPKQGGDPVKYEVVLTNTGTSTAYNTELVDTLPSVMDTLTVTPNAAIVTNSSTGTKLDLFLSPIAVGASVTIDYQAVLNSTFRNGQAVQNTATVTWESNQTPNANTRNGSGTPVFNNYTASTTASFTSGGSFTLTKDLVAIGPINTTPGGSNATIGETVTYGLVVTLPEEINPTTTVTDNIPAGLQYAANSVQVITNAAASGGLLTNDFNGTVTTTPTVTGGAANGAPVTFDFSDIPVNVDLNANNNSFLILFKATVLDVVTNQGGVVLGNEAQLQVLVGGTPTTVNSNTVNVTIITPLMSITKAFDTGMLDHATTIINSPPITVTLTVKNSGLSPAFNVVVDDPLPTAQFANFTPVGTQPSGFTWVAPTINGANTIVEFSGGTLAPGASATLTFTVTTTDQWTPIQQYNNTATVTHSYTLPGNLGRDETPVTGSATLTVTAPDIAIVKTASANSVAPNSTLTYTLNVSNNGPVNALAVTVTDTLPAGVTVLNSSTSNGTSCTVTAGVLTCNLGAMPYPGPVVTITINAKVAANATGTLHNTASVDTTSKDRDTTNNSSSVDTPVITAPVADLMITKTDNLPNHIYPLNPATPTSITYTVTATNNGPSDVTGAVIADTFPAEITAPTWTCLPSGGATCAAPTGTGNINATVNMPNGSSVTFTVTATIALNASANIVNTATITAPATITDTNLNNNTATDTIVPTGAKVADLFITKSDNQPNHVYTPGGAITYTLIAGNNGPSDVTGGPILDTLPNTISNITWTCVKTGTATCSAPSGSGNPVSLTATLPHGAANFVTITIQGTISLTASGNLQNTATITTPTAANSPTDTNLGNNSATVTDTTQADLAITKADSLVNHVYTPGNQVTYTITATNAGPDNVTGATITDNLPAAITNITWTCQATPATAGVNDCPANGNGDLNNVTVDLLAGNGANVTFTITGTVAAGATGNISNTVTITPPIGVTDTNLNNNSASDTIVPSGTPQADLAITKTDGQATPGQYKLGDTITYTIIGRNLSAATDVPNALINDNVPLSLTNVSWTCASSGTAACGAASGNGNAISLTANLPHGAANFVTITVTATASTLANPLVNTASIQTPNGITDSNTGNNSATDTLNTSGTPTTDLAVTKSDNLANYTPSGPITYTILVTNNGPTAVTGAALSDNVPGVITGVTWSCTASSGSACGSPSTGNTNAINTTVDLLVGGTATFTVNGTVSPNATGPLSNTATITAPTGVTDTNANNNTATITNGAPGATVTDLSITKVDNLSGHLYTPGSAVQYVITATNNGPSDVTGAMVTDTVPVAITGITWTCKSTVGGAACVAPTSGSSNSISAKVNLRKGTFVTITVKGTVAPTTTGAVSNTATITAPTGVTESNTGNNSSTDVIVDSNVPVVDLQIVKSSAQTTYTPGSPITYQITVQNNKLPAPHAPIDIKGATVTDNVPPSITGATWTCTATGTAVCGASSGTGNIATTVDLPADPANGIATFALTGIVAPGTTGGLSNTATIQVPNGSIVDIKPDNNTSTYIILVTADLAIHKSVQTGSTPAGATVTYTIIAYNNGPSDVMNASIVDNLPAAVSNAAWTCTATGGAQCNVGSGFGNIATTVNLPANAVKDKPTSYVTFIVTGTVKGSGVTNTATISSPNGTTDTDTKNNSSSASTSGSGGGGGGPVIGTDDPVMVKLVDPSLALPGENVTYTITVTNKGTGPEPDAVVTDSVPTSLVVTSADTSQGTVSVNGNAVTFNIGTINAGQTVTMHIHARIRPDIVPPVDITNTAYLGDVTATATLRLSSATLHVIKPLLPATGEHPDDPTGIPMWMLLVGAAGIVSLFALTLRRRRVV